MHYSQHAYIPKYVCIYVNEISNYFDQVILVTNQRSINTESLSFNQNVSILFVKNEGYDLGMFYKAFQTIIPDEYNQIACINDSNILINKLYTIFDWSIKNPFDFWGIIDSFEKPWFSTHQDNYHIQSHFIVFNRKAIDRLPEFFNSLDVQQIYNEKDQAILRRTVINSWEIGLSQFLIKQNLSYGSFIDSRSFSQTHQSKSSNISHKLFYRLIQSGYPLVKKKVISKSSWKDIFHLNQSWENMIRQYGNKDWNIEGLIDELKQIKKESENQSIRKIKKKFFGDFQLINEKMKYQMSYPFSTKIYVFYYKKGSVLKTDEIYQPVMAGNALLTGNNTISGDDTGENISDKNPYYSELTGIYWVWKNTSQDVTGTCHYRRFFTAQPEPIIYKLKRLLYFPARLYRKRLGLIYTGNTDLFVPRILNQQEINNLLIQYDAILPLARKLKYSVETHYRRYHDIQDLYLLKSILTEKYPEYLQAFQSVMTSKKLYANNMFILKDEHFQEFMGWWFDLLFEFERRIDLNKYTDYQKRILGFMAERLLNIWFMKKQLNCVELPVIYFKRFKSEL